MSHGSEHLEVKKKGPKGELCGSMDHTTASKVRFFLFFFFFFFILLCLYVFHFVLVLSAEGQMLGA